VTVEARDACGRAAIVAPALVAAGLCLLQINGRSLGFDEGATVAIASQHGSALWAAIAHDGGNMSGYYLLLHVVIGVFGDGLLAIRLPSAVASIATVVLVAVIGTRLFGRAAGFVAGLLTAVSLPLVFWAQYARGYAQMVAFVCGAFVALIALCESEQPRRRHWIAYVVLMALAAYSSFVAVLVIPAQVVALAWRRRILGRFLAALLALAICCVPLMVLALRRGSGQLFWVPRPTRKVEFQVLQSLTSAGLQSTFHRTATTKPLLILTLLLLLGIAVTIVWAVRRSVGEGETEARKAWAGVMPLAWFSVPVALTWVSSYLVQPTFVPRNVLMSVPPVALLLALGVTDRRLPRAVAVGAVIVLVGLRALQVAPSYGVSPEPWRQSTSYVLARAQPGDCMVFYPEDARMAFQYYVGAGQARRSWGGTRFGRSSRTTPPCRRHRSPAGAPAVAACGLSPATRASLTAPRSHWRTGPVS
jgi:mannosyltransferase